MTERDDAHPPKKDTPPSEKTDQRNNPGAIQLPRAPRWMRGVADPDTERPYTTPAPTPAPTVSPLPELPKPPSWMQPIPAPKDDPAYRPLTPVPPSDMGAAPVPTVTPQPPVTPPTATPTVVPASTPSTAPGPSRPGEPEVPSTPADETMGEYAGYGERPYREADDLLAYEDDDDMGYGEDYPGEDVDGDVDSDTDPDAALGRGRIVEPAFAYIIILVVTVLGLSNFNPETRYSLLWAGLAVVGAAAITIDNLPIQRPTFRELLVGVSYGLVIGLPLFIIGAPTLRRISVDMFGRASDAAVFQALAFAMPLAENLFYRGAFQATRGLIPSVVAAGLLSVILFIPMLNVASFPLVAVVIGLAFFVINLVYGYLNARIGLFTAWTCQIVVNVLVLWLPRLVG